MCHKRGLWAIKAKNGGASPHHDPKMAVDKPTEKPPRFYSADDVKKPLLNKRKPIPTRLRRVDQSYVIATSTKVDISGVIVEKFDDNYLAKKVEKKKKKEEGQFFDEDGEVKNKFPSDKKEDQKAVDSPLMKAIEGVADLKSYLGARFTLKSVMKPHELVF